MSNSHSRARAALGLLADVASLCSAGAILSMTFVLVVNAMRGRLPAPSADHGVAAARPPQSPISLADGRVAIDAGTAMVRQGARVALIEFADYQCRFCAQYERETFPAVKREFVDTGQVTYVFKDFPLDAHPLALQASVAARCAAAQGRYWEMHETLFAKPASLPLAGLVDAAKGLALRMPDFQSCLTSDAERVVRRDQETGHSLGVTVTPTFFVGAIADDGEVNVMRKVVGAQPIDVFRMAISETVGAANASR